MPFIGKLRKDIMTALTEQVIPQLGQPGVPLVHVAFPLHLPAGVQWWQISQTVLSQENVYRERWGSDEWIEEGLVAAPYPYIGFVFEGTAHLRVGLSREQAQEAGTGEPGIYAIEVPAPGVVFYPEGTLHHNGSRIFWEKADEPPVGMRFLSIRALSSALLVHLCHDQGQQHIVEHPLQISDFHLQALAAVFADELAQAPQTGLEAAHSCLLALMLRLRRSIETASFANTSWPHIPGSVSPPEISQASKELFELAVNYIQLRMHEKLTLQRIAQSVGVTPQHLNRVFYQIANTSVMRYVTAQRIAAARQILIADKGELIQEVAQLVGFENYGTFCKAFVRETSFSPRAYRQQVMSKSIQKGSQETA